MFVQALQIGNLSLVHGDMAIDIVKIRGRREDHWHRRGAIIEGLDVLEMVSREKGEKYSERRQENHGGRAEKIRIEAHCHAFRG